MTGHFLQVPGRISSLFRSSCLLAQATVISCFGVFQWPSDWSCFLLLPPVLSAQSVLSTAASSYSLLPRTSQSCSMASSCPRSPGLTPLIACPTIISSACPCQTGYPSASGPLHLLTCQSETVCRYYVTHPQTSFRSLLICQFLSEAFLDHPI